MKNLKELERRVELLEKIADPLHGCIPLVLGSEGKKIFFNTPDGLRKAPANFKPETYPVVSHLLGNESDFEERNKNNGSE